MRSMYPRIWIKGLLLCTSLLPILHAFEPQKPVSNDDFDSSLFITAIVSCPDPPHHAIMQCLRITSSTFHEYPTVGRSIYLSGAANTTLVELPPHSAEGWHRPPAPMWFVLLNGKAVVKTPWTGGEVVIVPASSSSNSNKRGVRGSRQAQMVLALDTLGKGHLTFYPTSETTTALQIPLGHDFGGLNWTVEYEGPC